MRIAVFADIHANFRALEAVLADAQALRPDAFWIAGDVVNRGPRPLDCLNLVLEHQRSEGWAIVRGNHEDYVLTEAAPPPGRPDWLTQVCEHSAWTCARLGTQLETLRSWPAQMEWTAGPGGHLLCVHASMQGIRVGLYENMEDDELHALILPAPDALVAGHTHVPFVRRVNRHLVVNAGAVGMPFDGDPRASYALLEWNGHQWQARIRRVAYDRSAADRDFRDTGYLEEGGALAPLIHREFERARPMISRWHREYETSVASGARDIRATVAEMIART